MKPVDESKDASQSPAAILDRLKAVDASSLDELLTIREEQRRIEGYKAKALELKERVAPAVHTRVMADYDRRASTLERQSAPLQAAARAEFRKLRALVSEVQRTHDEARQEKEELEFRHAVGELDDAQLATRMAGPLRVLEQCEKDRAVLDTQAARFVDALGSDQVDEPEAPANAAAPEAAAPAADAPAPGGEPERTTKGQKVAPRPPAASAAKPSRDGAAAAPEPFSADKTMLVPDVTRMVLPEELSQLAKGSPAAGRATLPQAALVVSGATAGPHDYKLAAVNGIGRSDENQIQIVKPGISRMHAVVNAVGGAFVIKDLDSQNGTFVNGERIKERQLADGDTIEIGTVQFVFRSPWPLQPVPAATTSSRPAAKR